MQLCFCVSDDRHRVKLHPLLGDPNSDYINANYIDVSQQSHTVFSQTHKHSHCFCYYVASLEFIQYMWTLSLCLAILYVAHHISFDRKLFRPLAVLFVMGKTFGWYSLPGISDLPKDFRAWSDVKRSLLTCGKVFLGHFVSDFRFNKEAGGHRWSANLDLFDPAIQSLHQVGQDHLLFMGPSPLTVGQKSI